MTNLDLGPTLNLQNNEFPPGSSVDITGYVPLLGKTFNAPNQVARLFLDNGKFAAMRFSTDGVATGATGNVSWSMVSATEFSVQLSTCPGDFGASVDPSCKAGGVDSALAWKVGPKPSTNPGFSCYLDARRTYYLNVVAAQEGSWSTSTCNDEHCTWLVAIGGN